MPEERVYVIVGCASQKRDRELEPGALRVKRYPAKDLYTSSWFTCNWRYAETFGHERMILSAKHGLIGPGTATAPYDASLIPTSEHYIGDDAVDALASEVHDTLVEWVEWGRQPDRVEVLAGERYLDQLRARDVFDVDVEVTFPLQRPEISGNGDQMAWVNEQVAKASGGESA